MIRFFLRLSTPLIISTLTIVLLVLLGISIQFYKVVINFSNIDSNYLSQITFGLIGIILIAIIIKKYYLLEFVRLLVILRTSLPSLVSTKLIMPSLDFDATIKVNDNGVPLIETKECSDAFYILGYIVARDRLFQMDMYRRMSSGRLSEVFGRVNLEKDKIAREIGFHRIAGRIYEHLENEQKIALQRYADGVNYYIENSPLSFEFKMCKYQPELWCPKDSVLVFLEIFRRMCADGSDKRMLAVMEKALSPEVVSFFTTDEDIYTSTIVGGSKPRRPLKPGTMNELVKIAEKSRNNKTISSKFIQPFKPPIGSNHWAVSGKRTKDGRAIIACDMHLELGLPNTWYRACLSFGNRKMNGIYLPGVPMMVAGSNGSIGWGFTRMCGDNLDLIYIDVNPENPDQYNTPDGWESFEKIDEIIKVKGSEDAIQRVKLTRWGPVYGRKLLGKEVALKWTALSPEGVNFDLLKMDSVDDIEDAVEVMKNWAGPPLNVMLADDKGGIAWTLCGRFPKRVGFNGTEIVSWKDSSKKWSGFIPPEQLPSVINPDEGFLVTANNRTIGSNYQHELGFNFFGGYRSKRIYELLYNSQKLSESSIHKMQLDTTTEFYRYYQKVSIAAINNVSKVKKNNKRLKEIKSFLESWDGKASKDSKGLALLYLFHQRLIEEIFSSFFIGCQQIEPTFEFSFMNYELPLRKIIESKNVKLLPDNYEDWDEYIVNKLMNCAYELTILTRKITLSSVKWGDLNRAFIIHPISFLFQELWRILNFSHQSMDGCPHCINVSWSGFGVSERFVFSPGREEEGIFSMPGGQSGHPLSVHYDDHHIKWIKGSYFLFANKDSYQTIHCYKK